MAAATRVRSGHRVRVKSANVNAIADDAGALSFGEVAAIYQRGRPRYPSGALDWLVPDTARSVLDLAAGTGRLRHRSPSVGSTSWRLSPTRGCGPNCWTRGFGCLQVRLRTFHCQMRPLMPSSSARLGTGSDWTKRFPKSPACCVQAASLVSCGMCAMSGLTGSPNWVHSLHQGINRDLRSEAPRVGAPFQPIERADFPWQWEMSREALLDLVASRSYVIQQAAPEREKLFDEVTHLLERHPTLSDGISMPYVTRCTRTRKQP